MSYYDPAWSNAGHPPHPAPDQQAQAAAAFSFHGEALARNIWLEQKGNWIVAGYIAFFALGLLGMNLAGQIPGQSFILKGFSDIAQTLGQWIGFGFCLHIALRLRRVARQLRLDSRAIDLAHSRHEQINLRQEVQQAERSWWAWLLLALGIAAYGTAGIIWTSYDIRMPTAQVPYPGLYDIGYVAAYPFFLTGTILLARRNRSPAGRMRLLLDAFAVIGTALTLSWFFLLAPSLAGLSSSPGPLAAFLALYFPAGDLLLIAVGVLLLFSPLSTREQESVLLRLCTGLSCLAVADSLLGYFNLLGGFQSGTLLDVLWPASLLIVGLAAIEYPRSVAREQAQQASAADPAILRLQSLASSRFALLSTTIQPIIPFLLALLTCAILLTVVAPRSKAELIQASIVAIALVLLVSVRQALTLIENKRLTMQIRGELVVSRRELQTKRQEASIAGRIAQEKQNLEEGIRDLQAVHARIARGDFSARATATPGPLLPIATSLNLMIERLSGLVKQGAAYELLMQEINLFQHTLEQISRQQTPDISPERLAASSKSALRPVVGTFTQIQRLQGLYHQQLAHLVESIQAQTRRIQTALTNLRNLTHVQQDAATIQQIQNVMRSVETLEQQHKNIYLTAIGQLGTFATQQQKSRPQPSTSGAPAEPSPSSGQHGFSSALNPQLNPQEQRTQHKRTF